MILKNPYWCFTNALKDNFCDRVIKHALDKKDKIGVVPGLVEKDLKKLRDSNVVFLQDEWIYKTIAPFLDIANKKAEWNFEYDCFQSIQFTKYKTKQFYDWHRDTGPTPYDTPDNLNTHNKIRKLSGVIQLTNPLDYKGGNFEIQSRLYKDSKIVTETEQFFKPRGSIIVFPSHLWHRVKPVTEGTRYSLVIWALGQPFK